MAYVSMSEVRGAISLIAKSASVPQNTRKMELAKLAIRLWRPGFVKYIFNQNQGKISYRQAEEKVEQLLVGWFAQEERAHADQGGVSQLREVGDAELGLNSSPGELLAEEDREEDSKHDSFGTDWKQFFQSVGERVSTSKEIGQVLDAIVAHTCTCDFSKVYVCKCGAELRKGVAVKLHLFVVMAFVRNQRTMGKLREAIGVIADFQELGLLGWFTAFKGREYAQVRIRLGEARVCGKAIPSIKEGKVFAFDDDTVCQELKDNGGDEHPLVWEYIYLLGDEAE